MPLLDLQKLTLPQNPPSTSLARPGFEAGGAVTALPKGRATARVGAIVLRMRVPGWLDDTRTSYDTVAVSYAHPLRDALAREPFQRGILALFAERGHAPGNKPGADLRSRPGRVTGHA